MPLLQDVTDTPGNRLVDRVGLGVLTRVVPRDLVDEVVESTGKREVRSRLLPARLVVYYVLALTLFYADAYEEVMRKLVNGLWSLNLWNKSWSIPTSSAISRARVRLGSQPLRDLFDRVAVPLASPGTPGAWYRGWRVMAIDGVIIDAPDTPENVEGFEKKEHGGGESAYPQVRVVALAECGTHAIVAAELDGWRTYERELARRLLSRVEPDMLVLADRGFFGYEFYREAAQTGAALVWRVKSVVDLPVLQRLPDGSFLSELLPKQIKSDLRKGVSRTVNPGVAVPVRVVDYSVGDRDSREVFRLVTSLLEPEHYPALELANLYAQRWELEITLDEIETHQIAGYRVLRSRKPDLVEQEVWGLLITHYAVRRLMHEAADDLGIDEDQISFIRSLRVIRRSVTNDADFPPSPL